MRCEYCGCEVWIPKGDQKTIVCDCGRTEHADPCYDELTAQEVANMPLTVRHKIIALHFDIEDLYDKVRYLEAEKVSLTKELAERQEQLDQTAHEGLELEAENKRLRELLHVESDWVFLQSPDDEPINQPPKEQPE